MPEQMMRRRTDRADMEAGSSPRVQAVQGAAAISNITDQLGRDEGRRKSAYQDSLGYWSIGIGRLIDARKGAGLSNAEMDFLCANDVKDKSAELDIAIPWWRTLDPARQGVLLNMAFQMGTAGLLGFFTTLGYVKAGEWNKAAAAMLQSNWAIQTPERAQRLAAQMRDGAWR